MLFICWKIFCSEDPYQNNCKNDPFLLDRLILFPIKTEVCMKILIKAVFRSSPREVFLEKVVLKICSRCRSVKLQSKFIEIRFWHGCSPVNLQHIFRTSFPKNTYEGLLLCVACVVSDHLIISQRKLTKKCFCLSATVFFIFQKNRSKSGLCKG